MAKFSLAVGRQGWVRAGSALLLGFALTAAAGGGGDSDLEAKVKSAYVYHLTKFVDWPALPPDTLRICVIGAEAVGNLLGELSNRQVRDHTLLVDHDVVPDPGRCQILYIGRSERRLAELLIRVRGQSVLTVSDREDFTRNGGIVGFYQEGGKLKLEINPDAARAANLRISAKLLEVARAVASGAQ